MLAGLLVVSALVGALGLLPNPRARDAIRLATFYHPPRGGTTFTTVSERFGAAIFTRGDEAYRDQLRSAGFPGPMLQFLIANEVSGPPGLRHSGDPCGPYIDYGNNLTGLAGDFCSALHGDERNFLHNGRGERLYSVQSWPERGGTVSVTLYLMNPAAPGWREYAARRIQENLEANGYTGVFLDNVDLSLFRAQRQEENSDGSVLEMTDDGQLREAMIGYLQAVRAQVGSGTVWANLVGAYDEPVSWERYTPYLDGAMNEYFVARWDDTFAAAPVWEGQLRQAEAVLAQGKAYLAVAQGQRDDLDRVRFALASYLLIARDGAYFRYANAAEQNRYNDPYAEVWMFDEYGARLDRPLGERYQAGGLWRRDFACGSVTVNVADRVGTIETNPWRFGCWRILLGWS